MTLPIALVLAAALLAATVLAGVLLSAGDPRAVQHRVLRALPAGAAHARIRRRRRLAPPAELEDPRPPRFAQGVGLLVVTIGLILHLVDVPWALPLATAMAFVAAFLNAVFGLCLGCQLYLLLQRAGILGRVPRLP